MLSRSNSIAFHLSLPLFCMARHKYAAARWTIKVRLVLPWGGVGWDGKEHDRIAWGRTGCDEMEQDEVGWDGMALFAWFVFAAYNNRLMDFDGLAGFCSWMCSWPRAAGTSGIAGFSLPSTSSGCSSSSM